MVSLCNERNSDPFKGVNPSVVSEPGQDNTAAQDAEGMNWWLGLGQEMNGEMEAELLGPGWSQGEGDSGGFHTWEQVCSVSHVSPRFSCLSKRALRPHCIAPLGLCRSWVLGQEYLSTPACKAPTLQDSAPPTLPAPCPPPTVTGAPRVYSAQLTVTA